MYFIASIVSVVLGLLLIYFSVRRSALRQSTRGLLILLGLLMAAAGGLDILRLFTGELTLPPV